MRGAGRGGEGRFLFWARGWIRNSGWDKDRPNVGPGVQQGVERLGKYTEERSLERSSQWQRLGGLGRGNVEKG